jgi:hypothetical protein
MIFANRFISLKPLPSYPQQRPYSSSKIRKTASSTQSVWLYDTAMLIEARILQYMTAQIDLSKGTDRSASLPASSRTDITVAESEKSRFEMDTHYGFSPSP